MHTLSIVGLFIGLAIRAPRYSRERLRSAKEHLSVIGISTTQLCRAVLLGSILTGWLGLSGDDVARLAHEGVI